MIDASVITKALEAILDADATLNGSCNIERSTRINMDPSRCPWVGIYPGDVTTEPHTLGAGGRRWRNQVVIQLVIQTQTYEEDGALASDELETLIDSVLNVINADLTLGLINSRITKFEREYKYVVFDDDESGSLFMPQVVIKLYMEVGSS